MESTKEIKNILKNNYVDGVFHTHVSLIQPTGKYQFNRQGMEELWKEYCNLIYTDEKAIIGLAEKPQFELPVLADIDIKIKEEDIDYIPNKLYTTEDVLTIIEIYQSVLKNIVENCNDNHLLCVLLEKPLYRVTKNDITYIKNGFHLHFPNLFLNKIDQEVQVIPRVKQTILDFKLFEKLGLEDVSEVIDKSCCKVSWLMYGSRKSEDLQPYKVTKIYNSELEEVELEQAFKQYQIFDIRESIINIKNNVQYYLPRILSIIPFGREVQELRRGLISPLKEKIKQKEVKKITKIHVTEALKIAKKLLPMIGDFRAEDRNEWMTIGWILYNVGDASPEALDIWLDFSARCVDKYDEANCIYEWEKMFKKDLTLGTLRYYASIDSPEEYKKFKREQAEEYVKESLSGSHNDIAKVLHAEYGNEFVCASPTNNIWFQFISHRWEQIEGGIFLREKISSEIADRYGKLGQELYSKTLNVTDEAEKAMHDKRFKQVQKLQQQLKSAPFKNNVMKECSEVFYDKRFREKLDTNSYLIAFMNGVYDLKLNIFRPGRPEDFLSKSLPINYVNYSEDDEKVHEIYNFLEKVFPDKSVRTYFMDQSSDIFVGGNHQKIALFWIGEGDNAKSVTQSFFEKMLGNLAIKFNTSVITGKKPSSGAANADLARAGGGIRLGVLEEPNNDEMINVGTLKHLTGNDTFYARDLFEKGKDGREIVPQFKLYFICNKLPQLKGADKATWNRIKVLPFESTFCRPNDPAPDTYEEQLRQKRFPMDTKFGQKIPGLVEAFAWVLLEHRKKVTIRHEPEKVRVATEIYKRQNDIYRQFIEECIIEDKNKYISIIEMYAQFKEWFKEGFPGMSVPVKNEIKEYFYKLWGDPESGCKWKGYRIRTMQDDIDDGNVVILTEDDLVDYDENENYKPPM